MIVRYSQCLQDFAFCILNVRPCFGLVLPETKTVELGLSKPKDKLHFLSSDVASFAQGVCSPGSGIPMAWWHGNLEIRVSSSNIASHAVRSPRRRRVRPSVRALVRQMPECPRPLRFVWHVCVILRGEVLTAGAQQAVKIHEFDS
jgi:hypothetical protein